MVMKLNNMWQTLFKQTQHLAGITSLLNCKEHKTQVHTLAPHLSETRDIYLDPRELSFSKHLWPFKDDEQIFSPPKKIKNSASLQCFSMPHGVTAALRQISSRDSYSKLYLPQLTYCWEQTSPLKGPHPSESPAWSRGWRTRAALPSRNSGATPAAKIVYSPQNAKGGKHEPHLLATVPALLEYL